MAEEDPAGLKTPSCVQLLAEFRSVIATPEFTRAPVMTRLLEYLVRETLAGRGDQLKAYAVAVDGLGRAPDFDAQGDSYPRVQVGRLRKMLARHQAHHPGTFHLTIPHGGYRVALEESAATTCEKRTQIWRLHRVQRLKLNWTIPAFLLIVAALIGLIFYQRSEHRELAPARLIMPPMLELVPIRDGGGYDDFREVLYATLIDGLRRTEAIQVGAPRRNDAPDPVPIPARYKLSGNITGKDAPILFLRLWRAGSDRLIWSDKVSIPGDPARLSEALAPIFVALTKADGVIPTAERAEFGQSFAPGYPCMLHYEQYRLGRRAERIVRVRRCLADTLTLRPDHAPSLAASAMIALDEVSTWISGGEGGPRVEHARVQGLVLARRAVATDPFSALAHFALARASLSARLCTATIRNGLHAVTLDPYDPLMLSSVGFFLIDCGDPRGEALIRRAIELDPNATAYQAPLVWLAVARGDGPAAREALRRMEQAAPAGRRFYYLTAGVALAADGDFEGARASWKKLEALDPAMARDPDALFEGWRLSPLVRLKSLEALRRAGLIASEPPAGSPVEPGQRHSR